MEQTVNEGQSAKFTYTYTGDKQIKTATAGCGCTTAVANGNTITAILKPQTVAVHLRPQGKQEFSKTVTVLFTDGEKDILTFKAICLYS